MLILSIPNTRDFHKTYNRALQGDQGARKELQALWDPYDDQPIECFICGELDVERPVVAMPVPDKRKPTTIMLLPLCVACESLPTLQRWNRIFRILRPMWAVRFQFAPTR